MKVLRLFETVSDLTRLVIGLGKKGPRKTERMLSQMKVVAAVLRRILIVGHHSEA